MYPTTTYPFWARLDEPCYTIGGSHPGVPQGVILLVESARDDLGMFQVLHDESGEGFYLSYASVTPLCQVCDDKPAVGLGVYHPTTLLCTACLEGEPGCTEEQPQCIGCDLAQIHASEPIWCDHNHIADEVRRLPTGADGAMLVCRRHYNEEMAYRATGGFASIQDFPSWDSLAHHTGA